MAKYKCKCGNDGFKAVCDDTYYFDLDIGEDKFMVVKVIDKDVIGDIECLTNEMVCDKCGAKCKADYEDYEWDWSEV